MNRASPVPEDTTTARARSRRERVMIPAAGRVGLYLPRTVSTGHGDVAITREATLPSRNRDSPERLCVPVTMRSARLVRAARTITSAGVPTTTIDFAMTPAVRACCRRPAIVFLADSVAAMRIIGVNT